MYEFIRTLNDRQALIYKEGKYFIASYADVFFSGPEVLVFPATPTGEVSDWFEVDGGRGYESLESFLAENVR